MNKIISLISLLILMSVLLLFGQQQNNTTAYKKFYQVAENYFNTETPTDITDSIALENYQQTIAILIKQRINDTLLIDCYTKKGIIYQAKNDDKKAIENFAAAIHLKNISTNLSDSLFFKPILYAGASYYSLNNFDSASYYFKKAENITTKYQHIDEVERLYNKMGALYYQTGNYKQSINYFNKTINLLNPASNDYLDFLVQYKTNLGAVYFKLKEYEQAMKIYNSLLPLKIKTVTRSSILHNVGIIYLETGEYQKAMKTILPLQYDNQIKFTDLARVYINLKNNDSAKFYLDSAIVENKKQNSTRKNITQGLTLKYYGDYFLQQNQLENALNYYQQSAIQLDPDFFETDINTNPQQFNGLHSSFNLFASLTAKAQAFELLYQKNKDVKNLISSLDTYKAAFKLAQYVERFLDTDEARLFLKKNVEAAYTTATTTATEVYELTKQKQYLEDAFVFSETSKASVLQINREQLQIEQIPEMPQELIHKEKNVKANIAKQTLLLASITDSFQIAKLQQSLADDEIQLSKIQEQLNENPKYNQLKYNTEVISIKKIQSKILNTNTALISYYFTKEKLISFVVTQNTFNYYSATIDSSLFSRIIETRKALESPNDFDKTKIAVQESILFNKLIKPIVAFIEQKKQLIIIPHNELHYIPFEILLNPHTSKYLVENFAVSYNYAASFLTKNENSNSKKDILAFAPFASVNKQNTDSVSNLFSNLPASKSEIETLKGKLFFDTAATKNNFLENAQQYSIIHLATHAQANDKNPLESFIAFYPNKNNEALQHRLYEPEIYNLNLSKSFLVILSACETGKGQLISGEGVMSLSRAFSYAGCPSVITSLWKAEDNATAYLTQHLHNYLQQGFAKDEALQKAKIDYLKDDKIEPQFKTPNFWAHLILVGDASAIVTDKISWRYGLIIGILFLLVLFFVVQNGYRSKGSQVGL